MLTSSQLVFDAATGKVQISPSLAPDAGTGLTPSNAGRLCTTTKAAADFAVGLGYDSGRLCADALAIASFSNGLAFDAAGRLVINVGGAIAAYSNGLPVTASGALACVQLA